MTPLKMTDISINHHDNFDHAISIEKGFYIFIIGFVFWYYVFLRFDQAEISLIAIFLWTVILVILEKFSYSKLVCHVIKFQIPADQI